MTIRATPRTTGVRARAGRAVRKALACSAEASQTSTTTEACRRARGTSSDATLVACVIAGPPVGRIAILARIDPHVSTDRCEIAGVVVPAGEGAFRDDIAAAEPHVVGSRAGHRPQCDP